MTWRDDPDVSEVETEFKDGFYHPALGLVLVFKFRFTYAPYGKCDWIYSYSIDDVRWNMRTYHAFIKRVGQVGIHQALRDFNLRSGTDSE